jgi:hypothetical protein
MKLFSFAFVVIALVACSKKEPSKEESPPAGKPIAAASASEADKPAPPAAMAPAAPAAAQLSCTNPSGSECTEFAGGDAGLVKQICGSMNGKFTTGACPQKGRLGICDLSAMNKRISYYGGGEDKLTAQAAKKQCDFVNGSWQP